MKEQIVKGLVIAGCIILAVFFITLLFSVLGWILSCVALGFLVAGVMWIIQSAIRGEKVESSFFVTWGVIMSVAFIVVDIIKGLILWFGTFFWIILIIAIFVWAVKKKSK